MLTLIAVAGKRGVSREKLLGVLWPDSESEAARQALYLGASVLQLNPEVISSDIARFDEAVALHFASIHTAPPTLA